MGRQSKRREISEAHRDALERIRAATEAHERALDEAEETLDELRREAREAAAARVPVTRIAEASLRTTATIYMWLREED